MAQYCPPGQSGVAGGQLSAGDVFLRHESDQCELFAKQRKPDARTVAGRMRRRPGDYEQLSQGSSYHRPFQWERRMGLQP